MHVVACFVVSVVLSQVCLCMICVLFARVWVCVFAIISAFIVMIIFCVFRRFMCVLVMCAHSVCGCCFAVLCHYAMHSWLSTLRECCFGIVVWSPTLQPTRWHLIVAASAPCSLKAAGRGFRTMSGLEHSRHSGRPCVFAQLFFLCA